METAKDILEKHGLHQLPADEVDDIIYAMKEIAEKAWEAGQGYLLQRLDKLETGKTVTAPDKSTFMKSLFSESIKDPSASG